MSDQLYIECRSEVKGDTLTGYASVFGTYADLGSCIETFAPGSFDQVLANPATDVRAFYQHDSAMLLGRQSSGTLTLRADSTGLFYELSLPKTSYANDVRELAARGDLSGMSIGFRPDQQTWSKLGSRDLRTHTSVGALIEISPVSVPAYGSTTAQLRSLDHITSNDNHIRLLRARAAAHLL